MLTKEESEIIKDIALKVTSRENNKYVSITISASNNKKYLNLSK